MTSVFNRQVILSVFLSLNINIVFADVQITYKNTASQKNKISLSKKYGRFNPVLDQSYLLINFKKKQVSAVNTARKQANQMPFKPEKIDNSAAKLVKLEFKKIAKGPKIKGFKTREYSIHVEDRQCATVFVAKKLLKEKPVKRYLKAISKIPPQNAALNRMLAVFGAMPGECWIAAPSIAKKYLEIGFPLKIMSGRGSLVAEATKVKTSKKLKSSYYKIPQDYQIIENRKHSSSQQANDAVDENSLVTDAEDKVKELKNDVKDKLKPSEDTEEKLDALKTLFD